MTPPDGKTPMVSYKKRGWGENNAKYMYTMENGRKVIETWYEVNMKKKFYRYGLQAKDLDMRLDPFLVELEGNMVFRQDENQNKSKMKWTYKFFPKEGLA